MICHCGTKMKCIDSRPMNGGTRRKWVCPACSEVFRTLERSIDEWTALGQLAEQLLSIASLVKETDEHICKYLLSRGLKE